MASPETGTDHALQTLEVLCREIARGQYDHSDDLFALTASAEASQTVRHLAESFGFMLVSVEAREMRLTHLVEELQALQKQLEAANARLAKENATLSSAVAELTIQIDRQRFKREVGAITESDYFQDLQKRAQDLRARHRTTGPESRE